MRIGIMLRHLGEPGGIGVYTENIVYTLLNIDQQNEYFLLFNNDRYVNKFKDFPNATLKVLSAANKLIWDQWTVLRYAKSEGLDIIFNPKLSIPLFTSTKTVLVMHGSEQFAVPQAFKWHDRMYFLIANRLYCRQANAIIVMTQTGAKDIVKFMGAEPEKVHPIYESYNELCHVLERDQLDRVKVKHALPDQYILFVGGISPIKNFGNILRAFDKIRRSHPHKLVTVGFKRWKYSKDLELIDQLDLTSSILFTDFIPNKDIPAIYNLADVFVFPSLYEGFGMPVLEAMACGCPVVTTETGCSPEVAGGAALLVDPYDPTQIAEAIEKVITDEQLRSDLIRRGLKRSQEFSWLKCARETLDLFECLDRSS